MLDALSCYYAGAGRDGWATRPERCGAHVNVFVGADNARDLDGIDTVVPEGAEVTVMPAVSGGSC